MNNSSKALPVLSQIDVAFRKGNAVAILIASVIALAPAFAFGTKTWGMDPSIDWWNQPLQSAVVAGGFLFSVTTVWAWMRTAVGSGLKAAAFCAVLEGGMLWGNVPALSYIALGALVGINWIAVTSNLVLDHKARTKPAQRAAQTRRRRTSPAANSKPQIRRVV